MTERAEVRGLVLPDYLDLLIRILVGGTFVYASLDKIAHPAAFAMAIHHYRLLPLSLLHPLALLLPWLELTAGLALLLGRARRGAALLIVLMLLMFMGAIVSAMARDLDISCGCFHTEGGHAVGAAVLLRDVFLLAGGTAALLVRGIRRTVGSRTGSGDGTAGAGD